MSMLNDIKLLLGITEKDLHISQIKQETYKGVLTNIITGKLCPTPKACFYCGSSPRNHLEKPVIVKNGTKIVHIRLGVFNQLPTILHLAKQRFQCKNCSKHWTAQSQFVEKGKTISRAIQFKIIDLLSEKVAMKLIAKICSVSVNSVIRVLKSCEAYLPTKFNRQLPEVLMVDEFRSHTRLEDKMSFICADGKTGQLIDILPSRKLAYLEPHFNSYPKSEREKVKYLVTDMNAPYFKLSKKVFPHATIVIDRFHVVKHLNDAFNQFRVREMKRLIKNKQKKEAAKLKSNWKFLVKNREKLNVSYYKSWRSFKLPKYPFLTEAMMVDRLLSLSEPLKEVYDIFHQITFHFRAKNVSNFFESLEEIPAHIDEEFRTKVQNLLNYKEGITNALSLSYSNGKIEAKNTHIKTMKRVSYGFRSFDNMRTRIFLTEGIIQIK